MVSTAPLRYEDGKRLKGIGTRASKSRLTSVQRRRTLLECLSTCRKEDKKGLLLLWEEEGEGERKRVDTLLLSRDLQVEQRMRDTRVKVY